MGAHVKADALTFALALGLLMAAAGAVLLTVGP